jgi:hypothetical protein
LPLASAPLSAIAAALAALATLARSHLLSDLVDKLSILGAHVLVHDRFEVFHGRLSLLGSLGRLHRFTRLDKLGLLAELLVNGFHALSFLFRKARAAFSRRIPILAAWRSLTIGALKFLGE